MMRTFIPIRYFDITTKRTKKRLILQLSGFSSQNPASSTKIQKFSDNIIGNLDKGERCFAIFVGTKEKSHRFMALKNTSHKAAGNLQGKNDILFN